MFKEEDAEQALTLLIDWINRHPPHPPHLSEEHGLAWRAGRLRSLLSRLCSICFGKKNLNEDNAPEPVWQKE